jgi:hypothetical protein
LFFVEVERLFVVITFILVLDDPLACILIRIKAHLLDDKQISSVRVFDEAKSVPLLGGHLRPKSII